MNRFMERAFLVFFIIAGLLYGISRAEACKGLFLAGSVDYGIARGVTVSGNYAYVADYRAGLKVIDITDPANPQIVGSVDTCSELQT